MDYKPLTPELIKEISEDYYKNRSTKATAQDNPTMVLVGGQPGAGKSNIAAIVRDELSRKGGYIHVDADRMREMIYLGGTKPTSEQTQADAGKLATTLRSLSIDNKRNVLEEGTFRSPESVDKFIKDKQDGGYKVELVGIATPREESILGIYQRFEMQVQRNEGNPRFVPIDYHDNAMKGFEKTVATQADKVDRIRIFERSGNVLFDSQSVNNKQPTALGALIAGQKVSDEKLIAYTNAWAKIADNAATRNAPEAYQNGIADQAKNIENMKKERLHEFSMEKLESNAKTILGDDRFKSHSDKEIMKISYFRGFHEKNAEFHESPPSFERFDNVMAARTMLADLPDVVDLEGMAPPRAARGASQERGGPDHSL